MKTKMDSRGRMVVPKGVRDEAGLAGRMQVEVRWRDGHIEIEPVKGADLIEFPAAS